MLSRSFPRKVVLLLLAGALAGPWGLAAAPRREVLHRSAAAPAPLPLLGQLWSLLASTWGETGCDIDPSGRCAPSTSGLTVPADTGCHIDPDGCAAAKSVNLTSPIEEGCDIDPSGCR